MENKKNRISFIEKGRIDKSEMERIQGGLAQSDTCKNDGCTTFQGTGYTYILNCAHAYTGCDLKYGECTTTTSYSYCEALFSSKEKIPSIGSLSVASNLNAATNLGAVANLSAVSKIM
jgi:hypothetical protein